MKLYRVNFKVRPSVDHPMFYELEFGYLLLWLFAASADDAGERAAEIVAQLPYELVVESADVAPGEAPAHEPDVESARRVALRIGFSIYLACCETGTETKEEDFSASPWP